MNDLYDADVLLWSEQQAALLRRVAAEPDIDFTAFFGTDFSARAFTAGEFGRTIQWDVPLLDGYRHEVLPQLRDDTER